MLNRRLLRIKVMQNFYAFHQTDQKDLKFQLKQLNDSIQKVYNAYILALSIPIELKHLFELDEINKQNRYIKLENDLHPSKNFLANKAIHQMLSNAGFMNLVNKNIIRWELNPDLIKIVHAELKTTEVYQQYCSLEKPMFGEDKNILIQLLSEAKKSEKIDSAFDEIYPNWAEVKVPVYVGVIKSLHKLKADGSDFLIPLTEGSEHEDVELSNRLLEIAILNDSEIEQILSTYLKNWDLERVALTDRVLLKLAVAEMLYFPEIPNKVTINEYIEISKTYSTPDSKSFLNGILDKILKDYIEKGSK